MPFSHLILCHPLLLLPSSLPSMRVFSNELAHRIRCTKYWSFSFSIGPSSEYSVNGLASEDIWFSPRSSCPEGVDWVSVLRASTTAPEKQVNKELLRLFLEFEDMLPPRWDMTENWK